MRNIITIHKLPLYLGRLFSLLAKLKIFTAHTEVECCLKLLRNAFIKREIKNGKGLGFHSLAPSKGAENHAWISDWCNIGREGVCCVLLNCVVTLVRSNGFQRNFSACLNVMTWMYIVQDGWKGQTKIVFVNKNNNNNNKNSKNSNILRAL